MAPGIGWDDAVAANKEKVFYIHSANAVNKNYPLYCFCEVREGIYLDNFKSLEMGPQDLFFDKIFL